jgi:hypothetical protein
MMSRGRAPNAATAPAKVTRPSATATAPVMTKKKKKRPSRGKGSPSPRVERRRDEDLDDVGSVRILTEAPARSPAAQSPPNAVGDVVPVPLSPNRAAPVHAEATAEHAPDIDARLPDTPLPSYWRPYADPWIEMRHDRVLSQGSRGPGSIEALLLRDWLRMHLCINQVRMMLAHGEHRSTAIARLDATVRPEEAEGILGEGC